MIIYYPQDRRETEARPRRPRRIRKARLPRLTAPGPNVTLWMDGYPQAIEAPDLLLLVRRTLAASLAEPLEFTLRFEPRGE